MISFAELAEYEETADFAERLRLLTNVEGYLQRNSQYIESEERRTSASIQAEAVKAESIKRLGEELTWPST